MSTETNRIARELVGSSLSRRTLIRRGTLSAAAIGLLAGGNSLLVPRRAWAAAEQDVRILNSAVGAEHEAIAAYQVGATSGLLKKDALDLAVQFQDQHKQHADVLAATVRKLGGDPSAPKPSYAFPVEQLKTQADVLRFAAGLEQGAVSAYLGAIPILGSGDLARAAASILGDEAMHWAVLRYVLGENPVPHAFVS
jgi:rubrerythrin